MVDNDDSLTNELVVDVSVRRVLLVSLLLMVAASAAGAKDIKTSFTERDVHIKANFIGPVARVFCDQGFPGPRMRWGITSQIHLPKLSVIKDIRLKHRKSKLLGLSNDRACYHEKGSYSISAAIPRGKVYGPTGKERLLFTAEAVYDIDQDGWVTFTAPVLPILNGSWCVELSIIEPRLVSEWALPKGLAVKELGSGKYVIKGKVKNVSRRSRRFRSSRGSTRLTMMWKVKNFAKYSTGELVGDLFRFNNKSGVVQLAGVPVNGKLVCLNVFVRGKAKHGKLGKVLSQVLTVPRERVFDFSNSDMGNVVIKNLGLHRQYLEYFRVFKRYGKLSKRSNERLKAITSSSNGVISPLTSFSSYKRDSFKRISDDVIRNVVSDLYRVLAVEGEVVSVTEDGWDILKNGDPKLSAFYEKAINEMKKHVSKCEKKSSWFFGDEQYSKTECKRQMRALLGAIEMVCLDCSICISTFHSDYTLDEKARLKFLRCVDIVDVFDANKGVNAYVAQLLLVRNSQHFTLPELSNLFWASLARQGYIQIPENSKQRPFYSEFIILPGFIRNGGKSDYSDFDIYCPLYDLYSKDYK